MAYRVNGDNKMDNKNDKGKPVFFVVKSDDRKSLAALKILLKADNMASVVRYCVRFTAEHLLKQEG